MLVPRLVGFVCLSVRLRQAKGVPTPSRISRLDLHSRRHDDLMQNPSRTSNTPPYLVTAKLGDVQRPRLRSYFLDILAGVPLPEPARFLGEPHPALRFVFVHHRDVLRVGLGHPAGEGLPHLRRELLDSEGDRSSNDLSVMNCEKEGAAAEGTPANLIGSEEVEIEGTTKEGAGGGAA
jgi:hypothetical protein